MALFCTFLLNTALECSCLLSTCRRQNKYCVCVILFEQGLLCYHYFPLPTYILTTSDTWATRKHICNSPGSRGKIRRFWHSLGCFALLYPAVSFFIQKSAPGYSSAKLEKHKLTLELAKILNDTNFHSLGCSVVHRVYHS